MITNEQNIRFKELILLKKGWLDGEGRPIQPQAIEAAKMYLHAQNKSLNIFPTIQGGVSLESENEIVEFDENGIIIFKNNSL